jgi:DNA-binding NarL/FixJ family response regulator
MSPSSSGSGGEFLAKKSDVTKLRQALPALRDVLVVEDETMDADRLKATLRVMFGYDLEVRRAATLASALDCIIAQKPEIVFLDDVLKPSDNASTTIPYLRRAEYTGPIVVVSGQVTRNRRNELLAAGATDVIHKDDVDSVRLGEALLRVFDNGAAEADERRSAAEPKAPKAEPQRPAGRKKGSKSTG